MSVLALAGMDGWKSSSSSSDSSFRDDFLRVALVAERVVGAAMGLKRCDRGTAAE
jgi:hypothetical protein